MMAGEHGLRGVFAALAFMAGAQAVCAQASQPSPAVDRSPDVFINGQPLAARSFDDLKAQIQRALREAYRE
jgi:hypothetical protein